MSQKQTRIIIGLLVVVHLAMTVVLAPFGLPSPNFGTGESPMPLAAVGAILAQPALLAVWAALAPQAFVRRFAQALAALAAGYLAVDFAAASNSPGPNEAAEILLPLAWLVGFLVCQAPLWLLRWRYRWQLQTSSGQRENPGAGENQFSVRSLLAATATAAAIFAAFHWLHPTTRSIAEPVLIVVRCVVMGIFLGLPGLLVLAFCWILLLQGSRIWRWSIGVVTACAVVVMASAVANYGSPGEVGQLVYGIVGVLSSAAISLFVVRLCGYRLVRVPRDTPAQPQAAPELPSRAPFAPAVSLLVVLLAVLAATIPVRLNVWQQSALQRSWRDVGLYTTLDDGEVVEVSSNDGSRLELTAEAIDRIGTCRNLRRLDLTGATADDETLARLPALAELTSLRLQGTLVSDRGLAELAKFPRLNDLGLRMTDIGDEALPIIAGLKNLHSVDLGNTRITAEGFAWLKQARPDLRIGANTDDNALQKMAVHFRQNRTRLSRDANWRSGMVRLHARGPGITDAGIAALRDMTQLEELDLTDARVTDAAVADLATLTGLKRLVLRGTQISDSGFEKLEQALADCEIER